MTHSQPNNVDAWHLQAACKLMSDELAAGCSHQTLRKTWNEVEACLLALSTSPSQPNSPSVDGEMLQLKAWKDGRREYCTMPEFIAQLKTFGEYAVKEGNSIHSRGPNTAHMGEMLIMAAAALSSRSPSVGGETLTSLAEKLFSRLCHECYIVHPAKCDCMADIMDVLREAAALSSRSEAPVAWEKLIREHIILNRFNENEDGTTVIDSIGLILTLSEALRAAPKSPALDPATVEAWQPDCDECLGNGSFDTKKRGKYTCEACGGSGKKPTAPKPVSPSENAETLIEAIRLKLDPSQEGTIRDCFNIVAKTIRALTAKEAGK